jgi:protein-tyrosine phosphatase
MKADIYEIIPCPQGRLATMARPRGADWLKDQLLSLKQQGVTDVVSMLPLSEENELALTSEAHDCIEIGLKFHRYPIPDRSLPHQPDFDLFIDSLVPVLTHGGFIAVHCRAGIGRSSVAAAALLCHLGVTAPDALTLISKARGIEIPDTEEQRAFILGLDKKPSS